LFWSEIVGMRPPGRPKHKWGDNIRLSFRQLVWKGHGLN